jgi:hypothetical protein
MFEVLCLEKGGAIWRRISFLPLSPAKIMETVDLMQLVPNFLTGIDNPYAIFLDPENTFFQIDDVGLITVMPIAEHLHCHITFWDGRLRGREGLCRKLSTFVTGVTKKELITAVPKDRRVLLAFGRRAGFTETFHNEESVFLRFTNYTE